MQSAIARLRDRFGGLVREVRVFSRDLEPGLFAPRLAGLVWLAGGLLAVLVELLTPEFRHPQSMTALGLTAAIVGAVALALPWQRWHARAQLLLPGCAFVLFAWGGALADRPFGAYLAMLPLPFVFVGFTQRPGTASLLAPAAVVSMIVAARFRIDVALVSTLVMALPMSVLVGEALALAQLRRTRAEDHVSRLLDAVRVLARVNNPRRGARLVAALSAEVLEAEAVAVMLSDRAGERRYLNRAYFGHPSLADAAPLLVDALGGDRALTARGLTFVSEPGRLRSLAPAARCVRAAAIVPLPGNDAVPIGLVIAMWTNSRRRLPASARQAAELLSEEAGRMFQRVRVSAALTRDAETDPLTELANRRTFSRALSTMQPGDALVIVDLDHFKTVNDRFGHQTGDKTLRMLARCLRDTARQVDCVARYGGEEFAVVLPEAGADGARMMLKRVRKVWARCRPTTTFSAGIAVHEQGRAPRETLRIADAALYDAKEQGRDRDVLAMDSAVDVVLP